MQSWLCVSLEPPSHGAGRLPPCPRSRRLSDLGVGYEARKVASAPEGCSDESGPGVSLPFLKLANLPDAISCKANRGHLHSPPHLYLTPPLPATPLPSAALVSS